MYQCLHVWVMTLVIWKLPYNKRGITRKFDLFPFVNNRLSGWELMVYIPLSKRNTD